ncbi:glycosyl transferase [Mesorhizobium sp. CAU 1741]|uniref:O-linked N-acetylglucosamine transferase, SPINDLY family protein n=1 Tax=Mesorhizobium sp. CAU 1741 TaxID=3140366 RepID=UPI00325BA2E5
MNAEAAYFAASKAYQKGQYVPALQLLNRLLDVSGDAKTFVLLAKTLIKLNMPAEAAASYQRAAEAGGRREEEYTLRAMELYVEAGDDDSALLAARKLAHKAHQNPDIAFILASIFRKRGDLDVVQGLRKPLIESKDPRHVKLATYLLTAEEDDEENHRTIAVALKKFPKRHDLRFYHTYLLRKVCDFDQIRAHHAALDTHIRKDEVEVLSRERPWSSVIWCGDERRNALATRETPKYSSAITLKRRNMVHRWDEKKLRIGYLSADYWGRHATMKLIADILRRHDRNRFDVDLFCYTPQKYLDMNDVDRSEWGNVILVRDMSDDDAAAAIRERNIDILVDLKGHTRDGRANILNQAAAPVQVAWLGFPGMTVSADLDYVIGDPHVLPDSSKPFYHEKFCRLPDSYQPNDPTNRPLPKPTARRQWGLPADAFVFASFNLPHKVSAEIVSQWAEILSRAPKSVLWLMTIGGDRTRINLLKEFGSHGIGPDRIVFADKIEYSKHINRQACADLALDTYPCNGHTTTSDSLWGGLPVLTRKGTNFASRVSESLLNAINLPDLIAADAQDYVERALELYANRERIAEYKQRIDEARFVQPLFDSERFCRHLEMAYERMAERAKAGAAPDHFDVPALPSRSNPFMEAPAETE